MEKVRFIVKEAGSCYFEDEFDSPRLIPLHFVSAEVMAG